MMLDILHTFNVSHNQNAGKRENIRYIAKLNFFFFCSPIAYWERISATT